jgi:hypothetical protein
MIPTLSNFQVQYLVQFITGLVGKLIELLSGAVGDFGVEVTTQAQNTTTMAALTSGIFGPENGLIYWINDKVFYVLENLPYTALGLGIKEIVTALFG